MVSVRVCTYVCESERSGTANTNSPRSGTLTVRWCVNLANQYWPGPQGVSTAALRALVEQASGPHSPETEAPSLCNSGRML